MLLTIILIIFVIIVLYIKICKHKAQVKIRSDPGVPFLGHVFKFGKKNEHVINLLEEMWLKYGRDKFILKIGPLHQVCLSKAEDVAAVLLSKENVNKNMFYSTFRQMIGDSVITYPKDKWQIIRKIVSPAFNYLTYNYYIDVLGVEANYLIKTLNIAVNHEVDIYPIMYQCILKAVCRNILGQEMELNKSFEKYQESIHTLLHLSTSRIFSSWKLFSPIYNLTREGKEFKTLVKNMRKMNKTIIEIKRNEFKDIIDKVNSGKEDIESLLNDEEFNKKKVTFIHFLLLGRYPNGEPLTVDEIVNEIAVFVIGGFETTVSVTSFGLYSLAVNFEVQEKALNEQLVITGGDLSKKICYRDIMEMKYLECVIKETMRMYTPVPMFGRTLSESVVLSDGTVLSPGTNVVILPFLTHKNPNYYQKPEIFNPDRFVENLEIPYTYLPFSMGPRNCLAQKLGMMQVKFFLATILRSFLLLPPEGQKPVLMMDPVMRSRTGINVRLQKRV